MFVSDTQQTGTPSAGSLSNSQRVALKYLDSGLSIVPVRADGSKQPAGRWTHLQGTRMSVSEALAQFSRSAGIGIIAGSVSGNLEVLDIEGRADIQALRDAVQDAVPGLWDKLPQVQTPSGGRHLYYRCRSVGRNQKLARSAEGQVLVETRGEGGYVVAPGSPVECHTARKPYVLSQGDLGAIPEISEVDRDRLLFAARSFDRSTPPPPAPQFAAEAGVSRPGDEFNRRATWDEVLTPHGWERVWERGGQAFWRRPGKTAPGCSATTNYKGTDHLYVFTTNGGTLEAGRSYDKFGAFSVLNHGGDYGAAARVLKTDGRGEPEDSVRKPATLIIQRASDFESKPIDWLWPGRIARGKLSLVAGNPGLGKSLLTVRLAATVSRGREWPDGGACEAGGVLIASAEDDPADTIRPRLEAAGADLGRVAFVGGVSLGVPGGLESCRSLDLRDDVQHLDEKLGQMPDVALLVVDPLSAYLGRTDSHKDAEVRALLSPLAALASKTGVALVAVTHLNKAGGSNPVLRVPGSIGIVGAARSAWLVAADPEDGNRRLFLPIKNNIGNDQTGLAFRIEAAAVRGANGECETSRIVWEPGTVTTTASQVMAAAEGANERRTALAEARDWLRDLLVKGAVSAEQASRLALAAGHSQRTLNRAKTALKVNAEQIRDGKRVVGWRWSLPDGPTMPDQSDSDDLATLATLPAKKEAEQ